MKDFVKDKDSVVEVTKNGIIVKDMIASKINKRSTQEEDPFFIVSLDDILAKHAKWKKLLPRIQPFFAVKCNNDPVILQLLNDLGLGFDCASKSELQTILNMGVSPSRIVYANPCKQASHIRFASEHDVSLTTFDNERELHKLKQLYPTSKLLLRILPDDSKSLCRLGIKYGAPIDKCQNLLEVAKKLELNVVGVSFHVGSGCYAAEAFGDAIVLARKAFDIGEKLGFKFDTLDIGGGFPGSENAAITFEQVCTVMNPLLDELFPASSGISIIAEPGRFFVCSALTLSVNVIARRTVENKDDVKGKGFMYYVNDGVYGSFNVTIFDHTPVSALCLKKSVSAPMYQSSIWGPTCDSMDMIIEKTYLPEMEVGDWLYFEDMGAYTSSAASCFNGFQKPSNHYIISERNLNFLTEVLTDNNLKKNIVEYDLSAVINVTNKASSQPSLTELFDAFLAMFTFFYSVVLYVSDSQPSHSVSN